VAFKKFIHPVKGTIDGILVKSARFGDLLRRDFTAVGNESFEAFPLDRREAVGKLSNDNGFLCLPNLGEIEADDLTISFGFGGLKVCIFDVGAATGANVEAGIGEDSDDCFLQLVIELRDVVGSDAVGFVPPRDLVSGFEFGVSKWVVSISTKGLSRIVVFGLFGEGVVGENFAHPFGSKGGSVIESGEVAPVVVVVVLDEFTVSLAVVLKNVGEADERAVAGVDGSRDAFVNTDVSGGVLDV
jgi:hypothetical protein